MNENMDIMPQTAPSEETGPLVSVIVITYNSAKTVLETLESIKDQTYPNIELIVSDDCSSDETVDVVRSWTESNSARFVRTDVVTTDRNTGVSGNINRGVARSGGEWLKPIAGDDLLVPHAIEEYIRFVTHHPERVRMCVCETACFSTKGDVPKWVVTIHETKFKQANRPYAEQRKNVLVSLDFVGPTYFIRRDLYDEVGGFTEEYGCAEEWPFVYKILRGGNQIFAIEKKLIRYRVHGHSLSNSDEGCLGINWIYFKDKYRFFFDKAFPDLLKEGRILEAWHNALIYWGRRLQYSIKKPFPRKAIMYLLLGFSPLAWKRRISRNRKNNN